MSNIKTLVLIFLVGLLVGLFVGWRLFSKPETPQVDVSHIRDSLQTEIKAEAKDSIRVVRKTITIRGVDTVAVLDSTWYWENRNLYALLNSLEYQERVDTIIITQPAPAQPKWGMGLVLDADMGFRGGGVGIGGDLLFRYRRLQFGPRVGYQFKPGEMRAGAAIGLTF